MKIIFQWFISALAIIIAAYLVPEVSVTLEGAIIAAVVLAAFNLLIRPILVVLTFPITILTLGFFSLVINALLVMLASSLVPGFFVTGFWAALFFALVLAIINWVFNSWRHA
jgi:putative membrane protein